MEMDGKCVISIIIMILKRRNEFRKQIRRKQIEEVLRDKREKLIEALKREGGSMVEELPRKDEVAELIGEIEKCSSAMKDEELLRKSIITLRQMLEKNSQYAIALLK